VPRIGDRKLFFPTILVFLALTCTCAQAAVPVDPQVEQSSLEGQFEYLIDPGGALTITDILRERFQNRFLLAPRNLLNLGLSSSACWVKLNLRNNTDQTIIKILSYDIPLIERLDAFLPDEQGRYSRRRGGFAVPLRDREIKLQAFHEIAQLTFAPHEQKTVYVRLQSRTTLFILLTLWKPESFARHCEYLRLIYGGVLGILIMLCIYNMLLYFSLREKCYLYAVFFTLALGLYQMGISGLSGEFLWPDSPWWAVRSIEFFGVLSILTGLLFSRSFLNSRTHLPRLDRFMRFLAGICLLTAGMSFVHFLAANYLASVLVFVVAATILVAALLGWRQSHTLARHFFLSWVFFLLTAMFFPLLLLGWLNTSALAIQAIHLAFVLAGLVLFVSLFTRIQLMRDDYEKNLVQTVDEKTRELTRTIQNLKDEMYVRQLAELSGEESEERFRMAFHTSPDAISINRAEDGRCVDVNEAFTALTGYSPKEVIGRYPHENNIWLNRRDWQRYNELLREKNSIDNFETELLLKNGAVATVLISSRSISLYAEAHILSVGRDITEWKRAELALRESELRLRQVIDAIPHHIFARDRDGRFVMVNKTTADFLKATPKELIGKHYGELTGAPKEYAGFLEEDRDVIDSHRSIFIPEEVVTTPDGEVRYMQTIKMPLIMSRDRGGVALAVAIDITQIKKAQAEKEKLEDQLRQSMKMEAIGRLAGGIAHDFNNLLTGILGYAELILSLPGPGNPWRGEVEEIKRAAERAANLTQQLLAFSRKQIIEPKVLSFNELVARSSRMLERLIGEDIQLVFKPAVDLQMVKVDPHQFDQVLMNLTINARDAMPRGGILTIETENVILNPVFCLKHGGIEPGRYVRLSVRDNGSGIPPDIREKIFEPFFTTKEKGKGTGLGLSMVFGIVEQNKGAISVQSELGFGTTFHLYLPSFEGAPEERPSAPEARPVNGKETVLIVEDEELVRQLAERVLAGHGYRVLTAENGPQALDRYQGNQEKIHLLLSDVVMPEMSGKELYERLCEEQPIMKVLFMSGYAKEVASETGEMKRGVPFIHKPFDIEDLARKVREVLE